MIISYILLGIAILLVIWAVLAYNKLIKARNSLKNSYAQIDVQLVRRYDLIPNLVETAKGYMQHENQTLVQVIEARNTALDASKKAAQNVGDAGAMTALNNAENSLGSLLSRLFALSEAYPDLKANEHMLQLTEELTSTENRISFARQAYNDMVKKYNDLSQTIPTNIIALIFNFSSAQIFTARDEQREVVKVDFTS